MTLPKHRVTFAQNREDLMLDGILRTVAVGFYVDVGANHPDMDSVTKLFYEKGWSGINVEPNERLYAELCRQRPRDINLKAGLSSQEGTLRFRFYPLANGLSTCSAESKQLYETALKIPYEESTVEVLTLRDVLLKYRPEGDIHFLKLDVEGLELEVLLGNAWDVFRPWVLCIERTLFHARRDAITAYLGACRYAPVFYDGLNDFFIANEKRALWSDFNYGREMLMHGPALHWSIAVNIDAAPAPVEQPAPPVAPPEVTPASHVQELLALNGEGFVTGAYKTLLHRQPDADGLEHYLAELNAGVSKMAILARLRNSPEGRRRHDPAPPGYRLALVRDRLRFKRSAS
jgi:FkbM family methyltransferase